MTDFTGNNNTPANASFEGELLPNGYIPAIASHSFNIITNATLGGPNDATDYYKYYIPEGVSEVLVDVEGHPSGNDEIGFLSVSGTAGSSSQTGPTVGYFLTGTADTPEGRAALTTANTTVGSFTDRLAVSAGYLIVGVSGGSITDNGGSDTIDYQINVQPSIYLSAQPSNGSGGITPGGNGNGGATPGGPNGAGGNGGSGVTGSGAGSGSGTPGNNGGQPGAPQPTFTPFVGHQNDLGHSSTASGSNHFIDLQNFEASYADLIQAFGSDQNAMAAWYNGHEPAEQRAETFDGLDYVASYADLVHAFGGAGSLKAVQDAGAQHFIGHGYAEERTTSFNGLDYIASYNDLSAAFGADNDAGAYHYIEHGSAEGRTTSFDGLDYIASYNDLINAFGSNEQAGAVHFITHGRNEGRATTFDGLSYIASNPDLIQAFGANADAGADHYIVHGRNEGRQTSFDVAGYETAHPDLKAAYATNDQFLTAYITTFRQTGHSLT